MNEPVTTPYVVDEAWLERVRAFARSLGLGPEHEPLAIRALTHRSLSEIAPYGDNERLEFLGDSVLALLVNDYLFRTFPEHAEGRLTKLKARFVSEPSLAQAALALDLGSLLAMAAGDEVAGGRERPSTLSDVFEAVLAAIYLALGIEAAREFVLRELVERVDPTEVWDHKSRLQELFQERHRLTPAYRTTAEAGPAHERVFSSQVLVGDRVLGSGTGRNKKTAEQAAAADALERLDEFAPTPADSSEPEEPADQETGAPAS